MLDYLLELYKNSKTDVKRVSKSVLLFQLLERIVSEKNNLKQYLEHLFHNYPNSKTDLKKTKFDFLEYRDKFLHRGELIISKEQILILQKAVFSLDEIIRIILQNLTILDYSELTNFLIIESEDIEKAIKFRRE